MRRVYAYVRVSGAEQGRSGTSLDAQEAELRAWCAARGLPEPRVAVEVESGSAERVERRVEQARVEREARPGDLVIVTRVDRWSRDIVHAVASVRALVRRGVGFLAVADGLDASTPTGDSTLGIMAWAADQERRRIYDRTVRRRKELRRGGAWVEGPAPLGYRVERRALVVDEAEAELVRELFRRAVDGASLRALTTWARGLGRTFDRRRVSRILRDRTYLGEVREGPRAPWAPGTHEAIVPPRLFEAARVALEGRRLGGAPHQANALGSRAVLHGGLAACGLCGARIAVVVKEHRHAYYVCAKRYASRSCRLPYSRVEPIDAALVELIVDRLEQITEALLEPPPRAPAPSSSGLDTRERLEARRERLIGLAADGTITPEDLRRRLGEIERELLALEEADARAARRREIEEPRARAELLRDVRSYRRAVRRAHELGQLSDLRTFVRELFEAVRLELTGVTAVPRPIEDMRAT